MSKAITGGEFLIRETQCEDIFIPEEWTEEQKMISDMCREFVKKEIFPKLEQIDAMEEGLMSSLVEKAGALGMLGISVPEELGGMGMDFCTSLLTADVLGPSHSFSVAFGAHTGIGTLPILYYGNDEQKKKYIPKLASGEWKASYCLTEPSAGSDANSGKTSAKLTEDGKHYIINGQKMWITNAGFADVFTVFAKIDDDENLSAFILTKGMEGLTMNPEEKKMGIKGSSTRQVFFNNVKVPIEDQLYDRGRGFKIAVNILNIGRIKLGAGVLGASRELIDISVNYANERQQFGRSISKYGAIRQKLATMAIRTFALDSAIYRAGQNIDDAIASLVEGGLDKHAATLKGIASFAPECAILKVYGSEVLDYVVDEGVQIHGGMGYSAETKVEKAYRDARINRIFEGTNEINRLLTSEMILKKGLKGELDLMTPAMAVANELTSVPDFGGAPMDDFDRHKKVLANFKKSILMVMGAAVQKLAATMAKEQEVLMAAADMIIQVYIVESTLLRVEKMSKMKGEEHVSLQKDILEVLMYESSRLLNDRGTEALMSFAEGDEMKMMMMGLKRFTKTEIFNIKESRQRIALAIIDKNEYCF
ncbi:MAG: alkylation response protein AidB-like acyl-CoA dehydrogenase [Patiriisocius sp.]|jgi:alkylation response protein AidB-like acyl-CoA dehydrogenase